MPSEQLPKDPISLEELQWAIEYCNVLSHPSYYHFLAEWIKALDEDIAERTPPTKAPPLAAELADPAAWTCGPCGSINRASDESCYHCSRPKRREPPVETSPAPSVMDRKVTVCNQCMCASCWQGQFYCEKAKSAGTITLTVRELRKSGNPRESVEYWFKDPATGVINQQALADYRAALSEGESL